MTDHRGAPQRRKLHRILALLVFFLLLGLSVAQAYYTFTSVKRIAEESTVEAANGLAEHISQQIGPSLGAQIDQAALHTLSEELQSVLPGIGAYLLTEDGRVVLILSKNEIARARVNPQPIQKYLNLPRQQGQHIRGDDPSDPTETSLFAAAKIPGASSPHFVYLVLRQSFFLRSLRYAFDENLLRLALGVLLTQILIALGVAYTTSRFLTSRIRSLAGALAAFRRGDYSARAPVRGQDELAGLAEVTNEMAEKIEANIKELASRDRQRRELIADLSHDLRTPATVLEGYSTRLLEVGEPSSEAERRKMYEALSSGSSALSRLLSQLWELSKLEMREQAIERISFSLTEMVSEIVDSFAEKASSKGVTISHQIPEPVPMVFADPNLIGRAISNLIENAITYTPPGGSVQVCLLRKNSAARIEIRDTGMGISQEDLPKIFDRSFRVEKSKEARPDSGGLGLSIVRRILEAHETQIAVSSQEQVGSTFAFDLPFSASLQKPER